jgi:citrate synthase
MTPAREGTVEAASRWWTTRLIDIEPGVIRLAGYPIEQLIGRARFTDVVWLMLRGELPTGAQSELLEAALVAAVDHGPHAPSIAIARMAVSCGLPLNGAVASAVNVLDDVHGGAGQQCLELYRAIARRTQDGEALEVATRAAVAAQIEAHGKIVPGFGHRFHPKDPRAPRLLALIDQAAATPPLLEVSKARSRRAREPSCP